MEKLLKYLESSSIRGFGSLADLMGTSIEIEKIKVTPKSDFEALCGDWELVGGYIKKSMNRYNNEQRK